MEHAEEVEKIARHHWRLVGRYGQNNIMLKGSKKKISTHDPEYISQDKSNQIKGRLY